MVWPDIGSGVLLIIFCIHFAVFLVLALRSHQTYQWLAVITFSLLIAAITVNVWWPTLEAFNQPLYQGLRVLSWIATAATAVLFLRRRKSRR